MTSESSKHDGSLLLVIPLAPRKIGLGPVKQVLDHVPLRDVNANSKELVNKRGMDFKT